MGDNPIICRHGTGDNAMTTGIAYFEPIALKYGASRNLALNGAIEKDSSLFAAASDDGSGHTLGEGDGTNALRMAQLKQAKVLEGGSASFNGYYETFISEIGSQGQRARTMASNQRALVTQIDTQRQSVMGVNLDEDNAQHHTASAGVHAMSRFITTQDELLDKIITAWVLWPLRQGGRENAAGDQFHDAGHGSGGHAQQPEPSSQTTAADGLEGSVQPSFGQSRGT
jgi:hypothetical protein